MKRTQPPIEFGGTVLPTLEFPMHEIDLRPAPSFYVSGPMTGCPDLNFPAFDSFTADYRRKGHIVISPAEHDRKLNITAAIDTEQRNALLAWDLDVVLNKVDAIALLPGWEKSTGARYERIVAEAVGKPIYLASRNKLGGWSIRLDESTRLTDVLREAAAPEQPHYASLIGLSGYAQSGKDTVADILVRDYGYERVAFADVLREVLYAIDPIIDHPYAHLRWDNGVDPVEYFRLAPIGWSDTPASRLSDYVDSAGWDTAKRECAEVRELLQRLGTEAGRNILGQNIWVDTVLGKLKPGGKYVFSDVRFPNEADAIKARGGELWRISRTGTSRVNAHPSETALDDYPGFRATVRNDRKISDLPQTISYLIDPIETCVLP